MSPLLGQIDRSQVVLRKVELDLLTTSHSYMRFLYGHGKCAEGHDLCIDYRGIVFRRLLSALKVGRHLHRDSFVKVWVRDRR